MFTIGYGTIFLYLASVTFFLLGMFYSHYTIIYMSLGALLFLIPSAIIGVMMKMRVNS